MNDIDRLTILLIEDDKENLELLSKSLPSEFEGFQIEWDPCSSFDDAINLIKKWRYDIVVTDIYRDRTDQQEKGVNPEDEKAKNIIDQIRNYRFCPIIAFTDGSAPKSFQPGPFIRFADKSKGNTDILTEMKYLIETGIPSIARKIHEELDRSSGTYLWSFLESEWSNLEPTIKQNPQILERLVRRRASMQLGRLYQNKDTSPQEIKEIQGLEYYIYPPISTEKRLGEIIKSKIDNTYRLILTPHCLLEIQPGDQKPRAEYVLTIKTIQAKETLVSAKNNSEKFRKKTQLDVQNGKPKGRYCFLPHFLDIPNLYCDLMQIESLKIEEIENNFTSIAVLDSPFAEAIQSLFIRFYATVGVPNIDCEGLKKELE